MENMKISPYVKNTTKTLTSFSENLPTNFPTRQKYFDTTSKVNVD